jgi:short-subunit dehydrogenase
LKNLNTSAKTALVTGAASGLGYELSLLLAADAYDLILVDIDKINLEKAKVTIEEGSTSIINIIEKDLSTPNAAKELFDEIGNTAIEVLINNAGFGIYGTFSNTDWDRESDMLNLHIITTTQLTKLVLKGMLERGSGKILNMSSLAAFQPGPMMSLYYASKAYILSFSEAIANELIGTGVTVTALCPGQTNTSFQAVVSEGNCPENKISFNMGCAEEVAKYGYRAMQKGKTVAVPGTFNKLLSKLPRFVSRKMATAVIRRIQDKNRGD